MTRTYTVVLKKEPTGGYSVSVPALPGCFTDGDTIAHALEMAREAIEVYLDMVVDHGEPIPRDKQSFYLDMTGARSARVHQVTVMIPQAATAPV
jgi:predicted RNase H-like HicB family nuclease